MTIRVITVASKDQLQRYLRKLFRQELHDFQLSGHAQTINEALALIRNKPIDIAIVDMSNGCLDRPDLVRRMLESSDSGGSLLSTQILLLCNDDHRLAAFRAIQYGAAGLLDVSQSCTDAMRAALPHIRHEDAIISLHQTKQLITQCTQRRIRDDTLPDCKHSGTTMMKNLATLSQQERQLLPLIGHGCNDAEIASYTGTSTMEVHRHVHAILRKLHLPHRIHAMIFAYRHGWAGSICQCSTMKRIT